MRPHVIAWLSLIVPLLTHGDQPWLWQEEAVPDVGFNLDEAAIYRVTSLNGKGRGTLRAGLEMEGPRIIVFEVGGVIDLERKALSLKHSQVIVAGQTAPSPGITLIRGGVAISASQVVLQHLRVRPGDAGDPKRSGWEPDGITTLGGPTDVWIDHCSATWAVDENLSPTSYKPPNGIPGHRIFVRSCIIAEALHDSTHEKGPHSKGSLVFGQTKQVSFVRNLFCSNVERNPLFQPDTSGVIVNNVIANPGQRSIHAGRVPGDAEGKVSRPKLSVVGNLVFFGQNTKKSSAIFEGKADGWFRDNQGSDQNGEPIPELRVPFETLSEPPLWPEGLKIWNQAKTLEEIKSSVGPRPWDRDATDARIVEQALTGKSRIIDSQDDVEGYPQIKPAVERPLDVPEKDRHEWLSDFVI